MAYKSLTAMTLCPYDRLNLHIVASVLEDANDRALVDVRKPFGLGPFGLGARVGDGSLFILAAPKRLDAQNALEDPRDLDLLEPEPLRQLVHAAVAGDLVPYLLQIFLAQLLGHLQAAEALRLLQDDHLFAEDAERLPPI